MGMISRASLVLRLWIILSLLAVGFSGLSLGTYTWLAVGDSIDAAHEQTLNKVRVVQASVHRIGLPGNDPARYEQELANELGIRSVRFVGLQGRDVGPLRVSLLPAEDGADDAAFIARATPDKPAQRRVHIDSNGFRESPITPIDVIRGGTFGEEYAIVATVPQLSPAPVRMVLVVQYPDVSSEALVIIKRSAWVGLVIVSGLITGTWLLLRLFVGRPLRRLSHLAVRIAGGDSVRMPAKGGDELNELGRALNGMADALQHQATVDSLTGLYNLRHLTSNMELLIRDAAAARQPLAIIVGDLDNLKPVNDTYGHNAGDKLLQAVSEAMRSWAGHRFTCWRVGGDEFAVALPNVDEQSALAHAGNLRHKVNSIQLAGHSDVRASISVGVSCYPKDGESAGSLLAVADRRMYALKALRSEERRLAAIALQRELDPTAA